MNNKTTLLIVEDDKAIVHFISSILSVNEYRTLYAGTGREAIALIASYRPDVVLLDLGLPDIDGLDVLKTVRQWSEVPIIVVSARGREQEKVQALDLGADDYITKPFGTAELLARIRTALRHSARIRSRFSAGRLRRLLKCLQELSFVGESGLLICPVTLESSSPSGYKFLDLLFFFFKLLLLESRAGFVCYTCYKQPSFGGWRGANWVRKQ